ncbi:carbon-nitrogen hydrolase [Acrodontium crateriforme]|uniref:Carbon-nitrogen hydrolase n=1 Tax=Acrodontium crateriforme TaxID=150365 RepID=A0AAQ3M4M6_9PEZI|nr:carbon-nitrogen hydrolase [Acrodontium crateriforme]
MKIATLQLNSRLGEVKYNIDRANAILDASKPGQLDLLVLPELVFTGYNFPSREAITPYLEPTAAGTTTKWAIETAQRGDCYVMAGYPEQDTSAREEGIERNFNSVVIVSPAGQVVGNYRKSFLYYTDETWASEGAEGHSSSSGPPPPFHVQTLGELGTVGLGICMDINPYRFTAPWTAYEFALRMISSNCRVIVLSMAWLTRLQAEDLDVEPEKPDMETVAYWLERFWPYIERAPDEEVVVVFANRCGVEGNDVGAREEDHVQLEPVNGETLKSGNRVCYAGSSCVMRFQGGDVRMFERRPNEVAILGKADESLLVVDTTQSARFLLQQKAG